MSTTHCERQRCYRVFGGSRNSPPAAKDAFNTAPKAARNAALAYARREQRVDSRARCLHGADGFNWG